MKSLAAKLTLAIVFPLAIFGLLECGLRIAGFGENTDFFVRDEQPAVYRTNPHFTELFFPPSFGLKPVNFRIARKKDPGSFRVFVIGESAAMGVPEPAFSVGPQIQAQLRAAEPNRRVEVFNLGVTAINSHAILRIVQQAVEFEPDMLVIYMGNNEVVGPYGPGSILSGRIPARWLIHLDLWLRSMRTGQLVQRTLGLLRPRGSDFKDWRGMEMFTRAAVNAGDPKLATVYANFAANLAEILTAARDAGVKVVLSTVAVNSRDCAPFVSQHQSGLPPEKIEVWQRYTADATRAEDKEDFRAAGSNLSSALAIDPAHAETHFRLARILDAAGDLPAACEHYAEALQLDALRFRADRRINNIIREAARSAPANVTLVDAAKELGSEPGDPGVAPAGANLFFEHVHFRWEGNYALARLLSPAIWAALHEKNITPPDWLGSAACADALGYTDFGRLSMARGMAELTGRPPFTGQNSYAVDRARLLTEISATEAAVSRPGAVATIVDKIDGALRHDPRNPWLLFQAASIRLQNGDLESGLKLNERLGAILPWSPEVAAQKAFLLVKLGRKDQAEELLLQSAAVAPFYFQTYGLLGQLWSSTDQSAKALSYFGKLVVQMPESRGARSSYAQFLAHTGDWAAAEQQLREVLRLVPDDESALSPLIKHLEQSGQAEEAQKLALAAYAYNPRSFDNNLRLVRMAKTQGDSEKTVQYLSALAASGPVNGRLYFDLAFHFAKLGRRDEARAALAKAKRISDAQHDSTTAQEVEEMIRLYGN